MKIMILTAATGGGHMQAAHAAEEYILRHTEHQAVTVDALKAAGRLLDKAVCGSHLLMAKHTPGLFGRLYRLTDRDNALAKLVSEVNGRFSRLMLPAITDCAPDLIISTHPFATEMVAELKEDGLVTAPLICIITDYGPHKAYLAEKVDAFQTACEDMVPELVARGVPQEKIHPFGIPVHEIFFQPADQKAAREDLGLDPSLPTLLFMAGSFGVSNIVGLYRDLEATAAPIQVVVITGKNRRLYETFEKELEAGTRLPTKLVFFTKEVEKYMAASDLLVTKPGGLTVSEALARNLPMAVFDAIPGQEEDNAAFLVAHGMGVRIRDENFAREVSALLTDQQRLERMRESCRGFDKSQAMPNLMAVAQELIKGNN